MGRPTVEVYVCCGRLHRLTTLVGMHQPLPPVTEVPHVNTFLKLATGRVGDDWTVLQRKVKLYDLLAIVMLDGLYRAEALEPCAGVEVSFRVCPREPLITLPSYCNMNWVSASSLPGYCYHAR
eukprot:2379259-Amphidinium_carterae.1